MAGNVLGGVVIPRLTAQSGDPIIAGGRYIETWLLRLAHVPYEVFLALRDVARAAAVSEVRRAIDGSPHTNGGAQVVFRLAEWPDGVTRNVYIIGGIRDERTPYGDSGGWHKSGRTLEILLEEA